MAPHKQEHRCQGMEGPRGPSKFLYVLDYTGLKDICSVWTGPTLCTTVLQTPICPLDCGT